MVRYFPFIRRKKMENKNIENTLKKMAIILDRTVKKIDELEKRVSKLEQQVLSEKGKISEEKTVQQSIHPQSSGFSSSGFGSGFLGSLLGSFAGLSLFNILFNNNVSAEEVAREAGVDTESLHEIEQKLDEISQQVEDINQKLEDIETGFENTDFTDEDIPDLGFDDTFDI